MKSTEQLNSEELLKKVDFEVKKRVKMLHFILYNFVPLFPDFIDYDSSAQEEKSIPYQKLKIRRYIELMKGEMKGIEKRKIMKRLLIEWRNY